MSIVSAIFAECRLQAFEIGDISALAGEPDRLALDRDAGLHHVIRHVCLLGEREGEEVIEDRDVRSRHDSADAIPDLDNAEHREGPQRLANERPTYAELNCQIALGDQPIAGFQRAGEQAVAQEGEHLLETLLALVCPLQFHPYSFADLTLVRPVSRPDGVVKLSIWRWR